MLAQSLPAWESAMGACFHFELIARLLAGRYFPAESVSLELAGQGKKPGLLSLLFDRLDFDDEEQAFLRECVRLRNKLVHCEPDAVQRIVRGLQPTFTPPNLVVQGKFPEGASGSEILEAIQGSGGKVDVGATVSREEGFLGWMLQASQDGTFELATRSLDEGISMLNRQRAGRSVAPRTEGKP